MSDKPTIVEALSAVMEEVQPIGKRQRNLEQGYSFRGVDDVVNEVGPILRKHRVLALPVCENASYRDVTTSRGKPSRECTVMVRYRFYGPAGDYLDAVVPGESMDIGDKGTPKAMSVALRILLLQVFAIPTNEPDPDSHSYERAAPPAPEPPPSVTQTQCYDELAKRIAGAESLPALKAIWPEIVAAFKAEKLTPALANDLRAELERLKGEYAPGDTPPEPASHDDEPVGPPPVQPRTRGRLFALLTEHDYKTAEERHAYASMNLGREVSTMTTLTETEARTLIQMLEAKKRQEVPV